MNDSKVIVFSALGVLILFGLLSVVNKNFELQNQLDKADRVDSVFQSSLEKTIEQRVQEKCKK